MPHLVHHVDGSQPRTRLENFSGSITLFGLSVAGPSEGRLCEWLGRHVGYWLMRGDRADNLGGRAVLEGMVKLHLDPSDTPADCQRVPHVRL